MSQCDLTLIGTCPTIRERYDPDYGTSVQKIAMLMEKQGWHSLLVYSDNGLIDPWLASTVLLQVTQAISPLIAVQPLYMHPFSAAKMLCTLSLLYNRPIHLNFVSGGYPHDLQAFCDEFSHDERYERVVEYATIVRKLLSEKAPCTFAGKFYQVDSLRLQLASNLPSHCSPMFTISGSSPAGLIAAKKIGAVAIQYLKPAFEYEGNEFPTDIKHGARLGIIARDTSSGAWQLARTRYPVTQFGIEVRNYYVKISDSVWVKELGKEIKVPDAHPYWLEPYKNGYSACPFLVGSIAEVSSEIASYIRLGIHTFLLDGLRDNEDAENICHAFTAAKAKV